MNSVLHYCMYAIGGIIFLPFVWFVYLISPFRDYTFTDAADFIFVALIIVTIGLILFRHTKTPYSTKWIKFAAVLSFVLAILTPLVPLISLYLLSWRAEIVLGHWPQQMLDDPKYICGRDALYKSLLDRAIDASSFAGWGLFTWVALLLHLRGSLPRKQLIWQIGVFWAAWIAFIVEPGGRFWWWLD